MITDYAIRSFIAATAFALAFCGQVYAITVYDVIKLSSKDYSNQDIVALIEVTNSAFTLKAEDISRLIDLGVSETVIQAMLKARHLEAQSDSSANPTQKESDTLTTSDHIDATDDHNHVINKNAKPVEVASALSVSNNTILQNSFNDEPFTEAATGGHHHRVITLSGIKLFVFRDEGQYPSVAARGKAVVNRLEDVATFSSGTFQPGRVAGKDIVVFLAFRNARPVVIVSVSKDDAYTYQRRSGRRVTPELLAAYWSALLSDYWAIAIANEPPAKLISLHEGEALQALYDRLTASGAGVNSKLDDILQSLPQRQQEYLLRLATGVPHDFNTSIPVQAKKL